MSLISEIRELEGRHVLIGMIGFLGIVAPGFLVVYHYHPDLIEKYDVVKLSIFSAALTTPVLFANFFITVCTSSKKDGPETKDALLLSAVGAVGMLYCGLLVAYLFHLSFLSMAKVTASTALLYAAFAYYCQKEDKKRTSQSPKSTPQR
jgi:hypothetical protein